jgi:hypothetical protein
MSQIKLSHYDYDSNRVVSDGEVSTRTVAKSITPAQLAEILEDYANTYSASFQRGRETGKSLQSSHRTLQRSVIVELCGIIAGLGDQIYTDARNQKAIALAKKIAALVEEEGFGPCI